MILNSLLCYKSVILYQLSYEVNFRKTKSTLSHNLYSKNKYFAAPIGFEPTCFS